MNGFKGPNAAGQENGASSPQTGSQPLLSEDQMMLLRNQMVAFKLLAKDAPMSPQVQRTVFSSQRPPSASAPSQTLDAAAQALDQPVRDEQAVPAQDTTPTAPTHIHETYKSPWDYLQPSIPYLKYHDRASRLLIPGIMASGVDVERLREERENIIFNRIVNRRTELEKLSANLTNWDTSKSDMPLPDTTTKLKAILEYKMLSLLPKQRLLRQQVSREMVQSDSLAQTANRSLYRRQKKQNLREARITERLEKQQRDARESKEKKKQNDYLRSIVEHGLAIKQAAAEQQARSLRIGRLMMTQHQIIEKEEQKRIERTAKQRLQALKANDEETYLKLLGQAKDSRISHLLKQTDTFLKQLASSVKTQQRTSQDRWNRGVKTVDSEDEDEEYSEDEDGDAKIDYYEIAHRNKEEVKAQSSNLVGGQLKEYQLKGLQWMISLYNNNLNGILADEMGLGKTIQTISLVTYIIEKKKQPGPFLVIVPLSTLTNWNNEFEKWAPSVQRIVYKGPPASRKLASNQIRAQNFQVLLTTYEFIIKDKQILSKVKWLHMIVDEGHRMKNAQSKLSQTITMYYHTRYRIILTGTPLQNNLSELWAMLNFVLPNIFKSVKSFDEWFNTPFANTGGQEKIDLTEEEQILVIRRLHKVLRPFLLRRLKKDVEKELPDKQERVIKCQTSALQRKLYAQLQHSNKLMVGDGKGGKTGMRGLSNMLMQLRKLCNHPFVFEEIEQQINPSKANNDLIWRTAGKFELLDRVLPKFLQTGHRILMFFQMTQIMDIMEDFMRLRGFKYLRLDGGTKSDERADLLKLFNAEGSEYFCFLLSTRAGGLGLNLQTADTVIIYDSDWNPFQDLQAQDRAHRIGQRNEVRILRLITTNTVEEKILERANFKLDMDGKVIQAGRFDNKSKDEERDAMLRVMLETAETAEDMEAEEMTDEDLNLLMMRNEDELEVFQKMDADRLAQDRYGPNKIPRLFSEAELPDIYVQEDGGTTEADIQEVNYGRGARERTKVTYGEVLTEEQWLDAVDGGEQTVEEAEAKKLERIRRRQENKEKRSSKNQGGDDSPAPASREPSGSPAPRARGASRRKTIGRPPKRTVDDASLDGDAAPTPAPKKARSRPSKIVETLQESERTALQAMLDKAFDKIQEMEGTIETEEGTTVPRGIADLFIDLPPPKSFPDYYQIIKEPICLKNIEKKINKFTYQNADEFLADIKLLCDNCRTYNEDGSLLFKDANDIEVRFLFYFWLNKLY